MTIQILYVLILHTHIYIYIKCDVRGRRLRVLCTHHTWGNSKHVYLYIPEARDDAFNWTHRTRPVRTLPLAVAVYRSLARARTNGDGRTRTDVAAHERTHVPGVSYRYIIAICVRNKICIRLPVHRARFNIMLCIGTRVAVMPPFYRSDYSPSLYIVYLRNIIIIIYMWYA
jgi:hypothetical protein